jgi:hypothetical protein
MVSFKRSLREIFYSVSANCPCADKTNRCRWSSVKTNKENVAAGVHPGGGGATKQSESFFRESNYHPSFDTIRHLLTSLYDGDIVIGIVKTKPCSLLNAIRLKKQTKFTD